MKGRNFFSAKLEKKYFVIASILKKLFVSQTNVCITTDIWSNKKKKNSFLRSNKDISYYLCEIF